MNIKLNVGGQIFETDYATIIKIPYFSAMLETCENTSEVIFVNRSSHIFKHVLALMIDSLHPFPSKYAYELDFYGVDYKNLKLHNDELFAKLQDDVDDLQTIVTVLEESTLRSHNTCKYGCSVPVTNSNYCNFHKMVGILCNKHRCWRKRTTYIYCDKHQNHFDS